MTMPIISFTPMIFRMVIGATCSARKMGSISSEVDRNTANSVPSVMTRPAHSVAAAAEKPHCGTMPTSAPTTGPAAPARRTALLGLVARLVLEPLHCQIGDEQKRDKVQRVLDGVLEDVPDEMRDVFHEPCLAIEKMPLPAHAFACAPCVRFPVYRTRQANVKKP